MAKAQEINIPFGTQGLSIETEQDPASPNNKALTNVPQGSLKHAVNVGYYGGRNLQRRLGYEDLWHCPETKTVHLTIDAGTPLTAEPTTGDLLQASGGAIFRVLSADVGGQYIRGIILNGVAIATTEILSSFASVNPVIGCTMLPVNPQVDVVTAPDEYDVKCIFDAVTGQFSDTEQLWSDTTALTYGVRGLYRYTYVDNRQVKSDAGYDLERYTIFATRDEDEGTANFAQTHTYTFRNRGTPNIHRLNLPVLDRCVFDAGETGMYYFSDVNRLSFEAARFWNYLTWNRGIDSETYLLGTYGGHYVCPLYTDEPDDWNCLPFLEIQLAALAVAPTVGNPVTHTGTGATGTVLAADTVANTVTIQDTTTCGGTWTAGVGTLTDGAGPMNPDPADITGITALNTSPPTGSFDQAYTNPSAWQRRVMIWFPTWYEWWADINGYTICPEVGQHNWFAPFIFYWNPDVNGTSDFYAEPCGRFMRRYGNSLFMARIERTELVSSGSTAELDILRWKYEPSGIMWSFWGYATGMELGTPPVYPFSIPGEPNERVWGCAAEGFQLNRHTAFNPGDGLAIVGMELWNESLYVMKPNGFLQIRCTYSGNFQFVDMGMSQGPCGPFAWALAPEGIYYVTKNGLYLMDGNPSSQNICLSDGSQGGPDVSKIFDLDIDWGNATNWLTGEIFGVSMVYDKQNKHVIISYPKVGEQGGGDAHDLPVGCPTRQLVYDTTAGRFVEWDYPLPIDDDATAHPNPGLWLTGRDPTDEDTTIFGHPIGNYLGNNDNPCIISIIDTGHRDNVEIDGNAEPEVLSGDRITYDATSSDIPISGLKPKCSITRQKQLIYCNNGSVLRKVIYNYHDVNNETALTFTTNEEGWWSNEEMVHQNVQAGNFKYESQFSAVSFKYYHDDSVHTALHLEFADITVAPTVGETLTQLNTTATMVVSSTSGNDVWGQDQNTGTWDTVGANTVTGDMTFDTNPSPAAPTTSETVVNPDNTNPDNEGIEWVMMSVDVMPNVGDAGT